MTENEVRDKATGMLICTLSSTTFARKDGGFGGPSGPQKPVQEIPNRAPDQICDLATLPQAALLYRLSADLNPLHADLDVAALHEVADLSRQESDESTGRYLSYYQNDLVVVDWDAAASAHPAWLYADHTHLRPAGARAYADLLATAVTSTHH